MLFWEDDSSGRYRPMYAFATRKVFSHQGRAERARTSVFKNAFSYPFNFRQGIPVQDAEAKQVNRWSVGIGYTSACDMRCPFCYSRTLRGAKELPLALWKQFFDRWHDHVESVNYGTGENTLRPGWFELVGFVREHYPSIRQALTTNGHLIEAISDARLCALFQASIDEVDISLDFSDERRHCYWRGSRSAFRNALRSLDWCRSQRKDATVVLLGLDETLAIDNLDGIFRIAEQAGAGVRINLYRPVNQNAGLNPPRFESVIPALDWIVQHHSVLSISDPLFAALYGVSEDAPAGHFSMRILSTGEITPSTYLITPEWIAGDITGEDVIAKIGESAPFCLFREAPLPRECRGCALQETCRGGCLDSRILHYRTPDQRSPYCPTRHAETPSVRQHAAHRGSQRPGMHAKYLPTLIFRPGKGGPHGR
jgi:radical SAM protein with 4Fe4S-binding SPASM domain